MAEEMIVLVDENGKRLGTAEKLSAHHAETPLHLAFSCYVFDESGRFLVTQRAHVKKVWPTVWTNTVCGHPMPDETIEAAIARRLDYELGMTANGVKCIVPKYIYQTPPYRGIIEHEYCPIFIARAIAEPKPNPLEVDDYVWQPWREFVEAALADTEDVYSWWCKDQLSYLVDHPLVEQYAAPR